MLYPSELRAIGGLGRNRTGVDAALQAGTWPLGHETSVSPAGLEPAAYCFGNSRAIHLRYEDLRAGTWCRPRHTRRRRFYRPLSAPALTSGWGG
jgi:hypothetical protein